MATSYRENQDIIIKPQLWITECFINLLFALISIYILKKELSSIKSGNAKYTTKYLKLWSLLCLICGPIIGLSYVCQTFDGLCLLTWYSKILFGAWQSVFMGMYQLSRLYYCFSRDQIYSDRGYPKYVFIIMFGVGILFLLHDLEMPLEQGVTINCGLNGEVEYKELRKPWYFIGGNDAIYFHICSWIIYLSWDFGTLLLYIFKIRSLNNKDVINQRVLNIMYRICILTVFYEIGTLITWWISFVFTSSYINPTICLSISMYLMMEHNDKEYGKFIAIVYRFNLHYLCCCYRHIIVNQVREMMEITAAQQRDCDTTNDVTTRDNDGDETHDISMDHGKIPEYVDQEVTELTVNCIE